MIFPLKSWSNIASLSPVRFPLAFGTLLALCLSLSASAAAAFQVTPSDSAPQTDVTGPDLRVGSDMRPDAPTPASATRFLSVPPQRLSTEEKFLYASKNTFSVSALLSTALGSAGAYSLDLYPEFQKTPEGYGRYYWHTFADQAMDSYVVDFAMASAMHIDPRYQPLASGGALRRTRHAMASMIFAQSDSGQRAFNTPQLLGSGIAASLSSLYYPERDRTASLVAQRWAGNLAGDAIAKVVREFRPELVRFGHSLCDGLSVCSLLWKGEHPDDPWAHERH